MWRMFQDRDTVSVNEVTFLRRLLSIELNLCSDSKKWFTDGGQI
jgi:hypothetical protein